MNTGDEVVSKAAYSELVAECEREKATLKADNTQLYELAGSKSQKCADLESKLAAAREAVGKAIIIIEPYCQDGDDQTMLEAALEWLRAALTEAGEGEK